MKKIPGTDGMSSACLAAVIVLLLAASAYVGGYFVFTAFDDSKVFARATGLRTFRTEAERSFWSLMVQMEGWVRSEPFMTTVK